MKLLDLFCGAGGCGMGYFKAGFEIVGVDIEPQPNYPFKFYQLDAFKALKVLDVSQFDVIHASPPCQQYSIAAGRNRAEGKKYPDLINKTRKQLQKTGKCYVIENVIGAPLIDPIKLSGMMFGLKVIRYRLFESNVFLMQPKPIPKKGVLKKIRGDKGKYWPVYGNHVGTVKEWADAMGIYWMTKKQELAQAIPPVYTEYIGNQLVTCLQNPIKGEDH